MSQVTRVVYTAGGIDRTLNTPTDPSTAFQALKGRFPELANGEYTISGTTMTVTLRSGSKA